MRESVDRYSAAATSLAGLLRDARSFDEGAAGVLRTVCVDLGWDLGIVWRKGDEGDNVLRFAGSWHGPGVDECELERLSSRSAFPPGVGLPGRVLASREPAWIPDVQMDHAFPRRMAAAEDDAHAGFALPIMSGPHPPRHHRVLLPRGPPARRRAPSAAGTGGGGARPAPRDLTARLLREDLGHPGPALVDALARRVLRGVLEERGVRLLLQRPRDDAALAPEVGPLHRGRRGPQLVGGVGRASPAAVASRTRRGAGAPVRIELVDPPGARAGRRWKAPLRLWASSSRRPPPRRPGPR